MHCVKYYLNIRSKVNIVILSPTIIQTLCIWPCIFTSAWYSWILEHLNTWIPEYLSIWLLGILEYLNTWMLECMNTGILASSHQPNILETNPGAQGSTDQNAANHHQLLPGKVQLWSRLHYWIMLNAYFVFSKTIWELVNCTTDDIVKPW